MNAEFTLLALAVTFARSRLSARDDEGLGTLEWVILVAICAAVAIAAGAIIVTKITNKANSIPTG